MSKEHRPMVCKKANDIWTITYYWREASDALVEFKEHNPDLIITAMFHEKCDETSEAIGKITLATEQIERQPVSGHTGPR